MRGEKFQTLQYDPLQLSTKQLKFMIDKFFSSRKAPQLIAEGSLGIII